jgi:hypothetical protein
MHAPIPVARGQVPDFAGTGVTVHVWINLVLNDKLIPIATSVHTAPHPVEQHFCAPGHVVSFWHPMMHIPGRPVNVGHLPSFGCAVLCIYCLIISIVFCLPVTGFMQILPQPFEQHFWTPGQFESPLHPCRHMPGPVGFGQSPDLVIIVQLCRQFTLHPFISLSDIHVHPFGGGARGGIGAHITPPEIITIVHNLYLFIIHLPVGTRHSRPHPFEQHFCWSGHALSFEQRAIQKPMVPGGSVGHAPGFIMPLDTTAT